MENDHLGFVGGWWVADLSVGVVEDNKSLFCIQTITRAYYTPVYLGLDTRKLYNNITACGGGGMVW